MHKSTKIILAVVALIALVSIALYFYFGIEKKAGYYVMVRGCDWKFEAGLPVMVHGTEAGEMGEIISFRDPYEVTIISALLKSAINIPEGSLVELVDVPGKEKQTINFKLVASSEYYHTGDTIMVNLKKKVMDVISPPEKKVVEPVGAEEIEVKEIMEVKEKLLETKQLIFKVQILISSRDLPATSKMFMGLKNVEKVRDGSVYKYFYGNTRSFEESAQMQNKAREAGLNDAFVVAFLNGKRISIKEARSLKN